MNIIISCIYKYSNMNVHEFNGDYLNELLDKMSEENKKIFPLSDCNINLWNYDTHPPTNAFLDLLWSHYFLPISCSPQGWIANLRH